MYLESIKPTDVRFTITEHGTGLLTWRKPDAFAGSDLEVVSVRRALSSRTEEEDSWKVVTKPIRLKNSSYEIVLSNLRKYEYQMRIHDGRKTSRWIRAIKQEGKIDRPRSMSVSEDKCGYLRIKL